jgi:DNA-3-methyladenine glycosylase
MVFAEQLANFAEQNLERSRPLPPSFYRPSATTVGKDLLGKVLVTHMDDVWCCAVIVEVEAYLGADDPASHAFRGPTRRNESMFGPGGISYVYLSYGVHRCMNVVTGVKGSGEAVLLRAVQPFWGQKAMARRRHLSFADDLKILRALASGPGKLTEAMGIRLDDNGRWLNEPGFKLVDLGLKIPKQQIASSSRIGISKGLEMPWRFFVKDSPFISRP